mmetsp:Transcript_50841/g.99672  ORF Transcript_50841/g.99672 Transcript_50841/m.99672 type:complete len:457 (+) Transcript_50841:62-1432(+)
MLLLCISLVTVVAGGVLEIFDHRGHVEIEMPTDTGSKQVSEFCQELLNLPAFLKKQAEAYPTPVLNETCRIYDIEGELATGFGDLQDGRATIVLGHQHFVWPAKQGERRRLQGVDRQNIELETLMDKPKVFRLHNFLSEAEVDQLVATAKSMKMSPSTAGLHQEGAEGDNQGEIISGRTSTNAWDQVSPMAMRIKERSFDMLRMPRRFSGADGLQVLHYNPSQLYLPHHDYFPVESSTDYWEFDPKKKEGSNRMATVFLYLSDVDVGGETVFPQVEGEFPAQDDKTPEWVDKKANDLFPSTHPASLEKRNFIKECRQNFRVKPKKGDAILFYHQDTAGNLDPSTLHGACPVLEGEKWGANLWIWNKNCYMPYYVWIVNDMKETIRLYSVTLDMRRVFEVEIPPGKSYQANTFLGRRWDSMINKKLVHVTIIKERQKDQVYHVTGKKKAKPASKKEL